MTSQRRGIRPHGHSHDWILSFVLYFQPKPLPHICPHGLPKVEPSDPHILDCSLCSFPVPCEAISLGQQPNKHWVGNLTSDSSPPWLCSVHVFSELQRVGNCFSSSVTSLADPNQQVDLGTQIITCLYSLISYSNYYPCSVSGPSPSF